MKYDPFENIDYSIDLTSGEIALIAGIKAEYPNLDKFWAETAVRFIKSWADIIKEQEPTKAEILGILKQLEQSTKIKHVTFKTNRGGIQITHPELINQLWETVIKYHGLRHATNKPVIAADYIIFPDHHELKTVTKQLHKQLTALLKNHTHASYVIVKIYRYYNITSILGPDEYDVLDSYPKYCDDRIRAIIND